MRHRLLGRARRALPEVRQGELAFGAAMKILAIPGGIGGLILLGKAVLLYRSWRRDQEEEAERRRR